MAFLSLLSLTEFRGMRIPSREIVHDFLIDNHYRGSSYSSIYTLKNHRDLVPRISEIYETIKWSRTLYSGILDLYIMWHRLSSLTDSRRNKKHHLKRFVYVKETTWSETQMSVHVGYDWRLQGWRHRSTTFQTVPVLCRNSSLPS